MISTFLLFSLFSAFASAGQEVGNGGDIIQCRSSAANDLSGYYSLDYLLTYDPKDALIPVSSINQSLDRIQNNFRSKVPELLPSFEDYRRFLFNSDPTRSRLWEPAPFGLVEIRDEDLPVAQTLPANCKLGDKLQLIQAAIRLFSSYSGANSGTIIYKYMPEFLGDLSVVSPVQVSFVVIHEWLWDHSFSVDRNRRINRFLHSQAFDRMSRDEILATFRNFGFPIPGIEDNIIFYPQSCETHPAEVTRLLERSRHVHNPRASLRVGTVKVVKRFRNCYAQDRCSPWYFTDKLSSPSMAFVRGDADSPRLFLLNGALGTKKNVGECSFTLDGRLECQYLDFNGWSVPWKMTGVISNHCLRAEHRESSGGREEQYVLYSDFPQTRFFDSRFVCN